ncbi:MAG: hypothetical protein KAU26_05730 [Methylococcales bacterium]|nr:hypothetical protein [Methylococcales bacterium]
MTAIPIDIQKIVNECLSLLENLNTQQQNSLHTIEFDVLNALNYLEIKDYKQSIASKPLLHFYATHLFSCPYDQLILKDIRHVASHCAEVIFETKENSLKSFYIKDAWEGAIKEGIGLEFNNLLTDTPIRYLCGSTVIITEKVFKTLSPRDVYPLRDTPAYLFAFGAWEVFTKLLHLTDRKTGNIRWNGKKLANIDFGLVFYRGKLVFDSRFTITEASQERQSGQFYALNWVFNKLQHPKIQHLLLNIDSKLCHHLDCHRNPAPPLRLMINTLHDIISVNKVYS